MSLVRSRSFLETNHGPWSIGRGRAQPSIGIDGYRMAQRGKKGCVVVRIGITPTIGEIDIPLGGILRAPDGLLIAGHHRRREAAGGQSAAVNESVTGEVRDFEMTREWRHDEIGRSGYQHRYDSGGSIRLDHLDPPPVTVANQDALAIFLAEREQTIARDALE